MGKQVRVMVLTGNGINCEMETAHACKSAGADIVDIAYLWDLASGKADLDGYDLLCLPGGFLDGDDLGSARASSIRLRNTQAGNEKIIDKLKRFINNGGLSIGICNGFQLMVKLGLLPALGRNFDEQQVTLTWNDSGRFEDRWIELKADPDSPCIFTRGIERIQLPVRHGEGKIVFADQQTEKTILDNHQAPLCYIDPETGKPTTSYPQNPNGSPYGITALTDDTGRLFGMMPHPEAFIHRTHHPQWTRRDLPEEGAGLAIFRNAIEAIRNGI